MTETKQSSPPPPPPPPPAPEPYDRDDPPKSTHPWRDNIEAITMAIIMAVLLKYFVVEAYKIPTGSMQPTLMGLQIDNKSGVFDRILVDKLSYHFRDPERFEVAVFKYPLDRSKNFIKRIWGMPGEDLKILNGDVFRRDDASAPWELVRRPRPIQRETLKKLVTQDEWRGDRGGERWEFGEESLRAERAGRAQFPRTESSIRDNYTDGYPPGLVDKVRRRGRGSGTNDVGDLRFEAEVRAAADCTELRVTFHEGTRAYEVRFPGPAASEDARPSIRVGDSSGAVEEQTIEASAAWRLPAGRGVEVAAQNLDDLLELEVDGDVLIEAEIPAAVDQRSRVSIELSGGGAELDELHVYRDIFYTVAHATMSQWSIPDDSYVVLGDNTQDSADGREWQLARMSLKAGPRAGEVLAGNLRGSENPQRVPGGADGPEVFFTDKFGERHHFLAAEADLLTPEKTPFVPRELITGRALLVFWPLKPSLGVYRLKWIH